MGIKQLNLKRTPPKSKKKTKVDSIVCSLFIYEETSFEWNFVGIKTMSRYKLCKLSEASAVQASHSNFLTDCTTQKVHGIIITKTGFN